MLNTLIIFLLLGLLLGGILAFASVKFHVETDPKLDEIIKALPGANCGACGYPGCSGCGTAIFEGKAPVNSCPVGGTTTATVISGILGIESDSDNIPKVARVKCNGATNAKTIYEYSGAKSCLLAKNSFSGMKACDFGCFGLGTCAVSCPFDAIEMVNGLPKVNPKKCTACGVCVKACPQFLMELIPQNQQVLVNCNNTDKGKNAMAACKVACIKCKKCEKACNFDAIHVGKVAIIDYTKCTNCGACVEVCPTHSILRYENNLIVNLHIKEEEKSGCAGCSANCER
ncbi:MAG: RnfABCDGE type electron transport complex subunit B [Firmicutes bacterium]|nr:RnfABCDGE type electron transport complex subunit B [Bacillota bacterium]